MYQEVCFNRGSKAGGGGGVNLGHSLSPPSHFMLATGLVVKGLNPGVNNNNNNIDNKWCLHKAFGKLALAKLRLNNWPIVFSHLDWQCLTIITIDKCRIPVRGVKHYSASFLLTPLFLNIGWWTKSTPLGPLPPSFLPARLISVGYQSVEWSNSLLFTPVFFSIGPWTNATPRTPPSQRVFFCPRKGQL